MPSLVSSNPPHTHGAAPGPASALAAVRRGRRVGEKVFAGADLRGVASLEPGFRDAALPFVESFRTYSSNASPLRESVDAHRIRKRTHHRGHI